ncbi:MULTISPECIES: arsenate reductase/protein-tyrosine-phosphatase family protein [unclassified Agromyces]|uniref:arsenate reductase/protein-tyrosine-phosphatase family protein n=1 Tax=unclassified Agromyces TaxID=2639701 RepID=UPI0030143D7B
MQRESFTVLVVCTGNLNRSALAGALLRTWADWYLPAGVASQVTVASGGLAAPVGSHMRSRTRIIAAALGADGSEHRAVQVTEAGIRAADLVLVAEATQRDQVLGFAPGALKHTLTIREAGAIAARMTSGAPPASLDELHARASALAANRALATGVPTDVIDPQGRDDDAYREMARQEVPALARFASVLFGMPPREVAAYDEAVTDAAAFPFEDARGRDGGGRVRPRAGATAADGDGSRTRGRRRA